MLWTKVTLYTQNVSHWIYASNHCIEFRVAAFGLGTMNLSWRRVCRESETRADMAPRGGWGGAERCARGLQGLLSEGAGCWPAAGERW